jgi:hypothetical protein
MRKLTIALLATAAIMLAGSLSWRAEATTPGSDASLPATAKYFSPVVKAACGQPGPHPHCTPGRHWVCGLHRCSCAPC